jgi:hypothetical protein
MMLVLLEMRREKLALCEPESLAGGLVPRGIGLVGWSFEILGCSLYWRAALTYQWTLSAQAERWPGYHGRVWYGAPPAVPLYLREVVVSRFVLACLYCWFHLGLLVVPSRFRMGCPGAETVAYSS